MLDIQRNKFFAPARELVFEFYSNGYQVGDPEIAAESHENRWTESLPETVDVLVVGSGPAGLMLAAQLSTEETIVTRLVERKTGPLEIGQADGVAAGTAELFRTLGLAKLLIREAYWINETSFCGSDSTHPDRISRRMQPGHVDRADGVFRHYAFADSSEQQFGELM